MSKVLDAGTHQFIDWIYEQDDNKQVNMCCAYKTKVRPDRCGCLMIQYAEHFIKEHNLEMIKIACDYRNADILDSNYIVHHALNLCVPINELIDPEHWLVMKNFGHAKSILSSNGFHQSVKKGN